MQETRSDPKARARLLCAIVAAILTLRSGPTAQETKGTARIRGTVTAADTGRPIRRAAVRLIAGDKPILTTTTDANGRFEFLNIAAGRFTVSAAKPGFVAMSYGQQSYGGEAQRIEVAAGQRFDVADIALPRGGVLTGRVFDEFGDPATEALVHAWRAQYTHGVRRLISVGSAIANDIGQFRLAGLAPGTYYLSGTLRATDVPGGNLPLPSGNAPATGFAPIFFPGSASPADAQPMAIAPAQHFANLDFALQPVRLARVSGRIVDSRGQPGAGLVVWLNDASPNAVIIGDIARRAAQTNAAGRFSLSGIAPGDYRIEVRSAAELEAIAMTGRVGGTPQTPEAAEFASAPVTVSGEDIEGFSITTSRGHAISGRVTIEGGAIDAGAIDKLKIATFDATMGHWGLLTLAYAGVQPDLTFQARGAAGTRVLRVEGLPHGWALKAVRLYGSDVTDSGFDARADIIGVDVIVARATEITGTIVDRKGQPAGERTVIVFPEDARRWSGFMNRYVVSARAGADGTFTIRALPPGAYLAAVVAPLSDVEWLAPENLERLRESASKISVAEGENKTLRLVVQ